MAYIMTKVILLVVVVVQSCLKNVQASKTVQCGVPQISKNKLILHGYETIPGAWPWHTAVHRWTRLGDEYICGGTLVSELFVITAAHCMIAENGYQISNKNIFIRLGIHNHRVMNPGTLQQHSIRKIHRHPNYNSEQVWNDIAILELATEAEFNNYVQPACLHPTHNLTGLVGTVIGWGRTENEDVSPILKSSRMPVVDFFTCLKSDRGVYGETLTEEIICAGYTNGTTVCNGDSGSGMFFQQDDVWYLGGMVSFTALRSHGNFSVCKTDGYGAFTNVHAYLPWITSITGLQLADDMDVCEVKDVDTNKINIDLLPSDCGTPNPNDSSYEANVFEYPWMVMIYYVQRSFPSLCEGSLISSRYVLTSAACASYRLPAIVRLGEHKQDQDEDCEERDGVTECAEPFEEHRVECVLLHQNYSERSAENDIALLRLSQEVKFKNHIRPICLPAAQSLRKFHPTKFIMSTWIHWLQTMFETSVKRVMNRRDCYDFHARMSYQHPGSHNCARTLKSLHSRMNGGTPLGMNVRYNGFRFIQFGVVSSKHAFECGNGCLFMYTNVTDHIEWIMANLSP